MKLSNISKIIFISLLTSTAFSSGHVYTGGADEWTPEATKTKLKMDEDIKKAGSAYGKSQKLLQSMRIEKENYNSEQLAKLDEAETLGVELKQAYIKTVEMAENASTYIESTEGAGGSYGGVDKVTYFNFRPGAGEGVEKQSNETTALFEKIEVISFELAPLDISPTPIAPVSTPLPIEDVVNKTVETVTDTITNTITNDVINIVPTVEVPDWVEAQQAADAVAESQALNAEFSDNP